MKNVKYTAITVTFHKNIMKKAMDIITFKNMDYLVVFMYKYCRNKNFI